MNQQWCDQQHMLTPLNSFPSHTLSSQGINAIYENLKLVDNVKPWNHPFSNSPKPVDGWLHSIWSRMYSGIVNAMLHLFLFQKGISLKQLEFMWTAPKMHGVGGNGWSIRSMWRRRKRRCDVKAIQFLCGWNWAKWK